MGNHMIGEAMAGAAAGYLAARNTRARIDGNEIWELLFSRLNGQVPDALTEDVLSNLADDLNRVFILPEITKEEALAVLSAVGEEFRGGDAEFDDYLIGWTPLCQLVAVAFDATEQEIADCKGELEETDDEDNEWYSPWYEGPETRFRKYFEFC